MASNRDPRYSIGMVRSAFAALFAAFGLCVYLLLSIFMEFEHSRHISDTGTHATGVVYRLTVHPHTSSEWVYDVAYVFTVDGREYRGESPVSYGDFNSTQKGDAISIRYLPGDPNTSVAAKSIDQEQDISNIKALIYGFIMLLVIGLSTMNVVKKTAKYRS